VADDLSPGDLVSVRVLERHPWGLDVAVAQRADQIGFVEPNMISDGYLAGVEDFPSPGRVLDATYLGDTSQGLLRFSLRTNDRP
jgi:hypothetical protein